MIQQYLLGALAGVVVTAFAALAAHRLASVKAMGRLRSGADRQVETLTRANAAQSELIALHEQEKQDLDAAIAQLCEDLQQQSDSADEVRSELKAALEGKKVGRIDRRRLDADHDLIGGGLGDRNAGE